MTIQDLLIAPIFLLILYGIAYSRKAKLTNPLTKKYYFKALHLRFFGCVAFACVYQFYYGGGDTFNFFHDSAIIWNSFWDRFDIGLQIILDKPGTLNPSTQSYISYLYFYTDKQSMVVIKLSALLGFLTYHTYLANAFIFAFIGFTGVWAMYRAMVDMYPSLYKKIAFACFMMPSVFFWGSGLMKDTLIVSALGWAFYAFYFAFIKKQKILKNTLILIVALWLMQKVKIYVAMCFLPAAATWLLLEYQNKIRIALIRILILPIVLLASVPVGYVAVSKLTEGTRFSFEEIGQTTKTNTEWNAISGSASYSLGEYDGTIGSVISKFPAAVVVSLFQPFLWQVRNPLMLLASLQATFILLLTLQTFFKTGFFKFFKILFSKPFLIFCLIFTLILAFGTGVGSGNYGSLDRYRIPFIPFYVMLLWALQYFAKNQKRRVQFA